MALNNMQWPIEKTRQVIWDVQHVYGRIQWKWTLEDLERTLGMAHQGFLNESDSTWGSKAVIVPWSNLVATWKIRPNGHYFLISTHVPLVRLVVFWLLSCN